ncbi:hypothetical protein [Phytoactinopolyspora halotolerans]|uniref:Uncharacterized protein n=1 Tax=Phytoactinopolyspora halotolerans TaxID=1981512 RepID=A0A6L9S5U2_9ACTN|nr:hypothetical protein [Phytoactinopolyspora halotolerans]NEE00526.1 hypothetical protein [Phytoactinopolyspora halotolerans]
MSEPPPPPPPQRPDPPSSQSSRPAEVHPSHAPVTADRPGAVRRWRVATALTAALGLALSGTVYLVMDRRVENLEDDLAAAESRTDLGDLLDLMEGLDLGELLDDGADALGDEGLGDGGGLGTEDLGVDTAVFECLAPGMTDLNSDSIPDTEIEEQVRAVREIVESERGLSADGELDIEFVPADELQRRVVEMSEEDLDAEAIAVESRMLATLGAVEPDLDLAQAQLDALGEGVAGFYNPDTQELVIGSEQMDPMGTYVTAHEMVHALADATFGLPDLDTLASDEGSDAALAALSALEGDATLYGQMMITTHLSLTDLLTLELESSGTTASLDALPHYVERSLSFPYLEGMSFACHAYLDGDWAAIDDLYAQVPTTSAQILFPERYASGEEAQDVRDLDGPDGWQEVHRDTFGAADLLFLLEAPGGDENAALDDALGRTEAWAGGEVTVWDRSGDTAVGVVLAEHPDGTDLCDTVREYYGAAFPDAASTAEDDGRHVFDGPSQSAVIACDGIDEVALGIGPDIDIASAAIDVPAGEADTAR